MARHLIRALGGIALAGACLALAACTSSGSSSGSSSAPGKADSGPVKSGTVTVRDGNKVLCVMTVVNGKGTCTVSSSTLPLGPNAIVGYYKGSGYKPAQSQQVYLSVVKAATSVALSVSPAKVTYGDEQVAHVTVQVTAAHGAVPTGNVLVGFGKTIVCTIKLANGAGSCTLSARQLKAGTESLVANYPGDNAHFGSSSQVEKITVAG